MVVVAQAAAAVALVVRPLDSAMHLRRPILTGFRSKCYSSIDYGPFFEGHQINVVFLYLLQVSAILRR